MFIKSVSKRYSGSGSAKAGIEWNGTASSFYIKNQRCDLFPRFFAFQSITAQKAEVKIEGLEVYS